MSAVLLPAAAIAPLAVPMHPDWLAALLPRGLSGAYVLLRGGRPRYVGRSDACLLARLSGHDLRGDATHVAWTVCADAAHAFHAECHWYHAMAGEAGVLNRIHPASPRRSGLACQFCGAAARTAADAVRQLAGMGRRAQAVGDDDNHTSKGGMA